MTVLILSRDLASIATKHFKIAKNAKARFALNAVQVLISTREFASSAVVI
jgi:hypothetical protein